MRNSRIIPATSSWPQLLTRSFSQDGSFCSALPENREELHPLRVAAHVAAEMAEVCGCSGVADWWRSPSAAGLCELHPSRVTANVTEKMAEVCGCYALTFWA